MDAVDLLRRLHQHRAWANRNLVAAATHLSDEQLTTSFPIGQGSVWKSLCHLYGAEWVWLEALLGNDDPLLPGDSPEKIPGNQLGEGGLAGLDDLRRKWALLDERWLAYLASLKPEQLDEMVAKYSLTAAGKKHFISRRSDVLLHICTHAQYTVAQIVNMFRQLGVEKLPQVMLIALARLEAS